MLHRDKSTLLLNEMIVIYFCDRTISLKGLFGFFAELV